MSKSLVQSNFPHVCCGLLCHTFQIFICTWMLKSIYIYFFPLHNFELPCDGPSQAAIFVPKVIFVSVQVLKCYKEMTKTKPAENKTHTFMYTSEGKTALASSCFILNCASLARIAHVLNSLTLSHSLQINTSSNLISLLHIV